MAKTGRPQVEVDPEQIEKLAAINCSWAEIAAVLGVGERTIRRRFGHAYKKGREHGRMSLKRKMWETAHGGNITMMIWLSKQMLGYTDKREDTLKADIVNTTPDKAREELRQIIRDPKALALAKQFRDQVKPKDAGTGLVEDVPSVDGIPPDTGTV